MPAKVRSPLVELGFRDRDPSADDAVVRVAVFLIRASEFVNHPYFNTPGPIEGIVMRELVFESLAYRVRAIAMVDSDDSSIWSALRSFEEASVLSLSEIDRLKRMYVGWLTISDTELRRFWPSWEVEQPQASLLVPHDTDSSSPVRDLWDKVFGSGPHSDYRRLFRTRVMEAAPDATRYKTARYGKLIASIAAVEPLVSEMHQAAFEYLSIPIDKRPPLRATRT